MLSGNECPVMLRGAEKNGKYCHWHGGMLYRIAL